MSKISHANLAAVKTRFQEARVNAKRASRQANIDILWEALESIRLSGSAPYSLAEIGRRTEKMGGMKTQSLHNEPGKELRQLIELYENAVDVGHPPLDASQVDKAIALIPDPSLRVVLKMQQKEHQRLKHENDQLRAAFKNLSLGATTPGNPSSPAQELLPPTAPSLPKHLRDALMKGLNPSRLNERGLRITDNGSIVDEQEIVVFPPGFAVAIKALTNL